MRLFTCLLTHPHIIHSIPFPRLPLSIFNDIAVRTHARRECDGVRHISHDLTIQFVHITHSLVGYSYRENNLHLFANEERKSLITYLVGDLCAVTRFLFLIRIHFLCSWCNRVLKANIAWWHETTLFPFGFHLISNHEHCSQCIWRDSSLKWIWNNIKLKSTRHTKLSRFRHMHADQLRSHISVQYLLIRSHARTYTMASHEVNNTREQLSAKWHSHSHLFRLLIVKSNSLALYTFVQCIETRVRIYLYAIYSTQASVRFSTRLAYETFNNVSIRKRIRISWLLV